MGARATRWFTTVELSIAIVASAGCGSSVGAPPVIGVGGGAGISPGSGGGTSDSGAGGVKLADAGSVSGIPGDRLAPGGWRASAWKDPSPGAWTVVDASTVGITPGSGDISQKLTSAVGSFSRPTILHFGPGTYDLGNVWLSHSDVILQGAGPSQTIFHVLAGGGGITFGGEITSDCRQITADALPGSTTVAVSDASGLAVGDIVVVSEDLEKWSYDFARRGRGGTFALAAVGAGSITLDVPLAIGLSNVGTAQRNATVCKVDAVRNVGIEDVQFTHEVTTSGGTTITFKRVYNGYLRRVQSVNASMHHMQVEHSHKIAVTGCFFDEAQNKGGGGNGYGFNTFLTTEMLMADNIVKDLRHQLGVEMGSSYLVYAYNHHVDRVRDKCLTDKPAECTQQSWIESAAANGITSGTLESDLCLHGNYPHTNLLEGNVGYIAVFDYVHYANGPNHVVFRNLLRGQPKPYGYWQEGDAGWVDGPSDHETFIGNHLLNDSVIQLLMSDGPRLPLETFIGANVVHGAVEARDLPPNASLPPSLFLAGKPDFWPVDLAWPPFGPDVTGSATNKIPAELRYESGQYFPK